MQYRYFLEPYKDLSSRHLCPSCGKKELTFYIDTETGEPLNPNVGKCNREINCGYHYTPKQYFIDNNIFAETSSLVATRTPPVKAEQKEISYVAFDILKATLKNYDNNNFIKFLISKFGESITIELIQKYFIGTSKHWNGATVFYQRDIEGKIRAGKIMLYDAKTGKRTKVPFDHITWLHKLLELANFSLSQSLFGEHLLTDKSKPIAVVESEKTAIICSVYLPHFFWLATGGMQNLKADLFRNLQNRKVVFFPDLKCFDLWTVKAKKLGLKNYSISDLLEDNACEEDKKLGLDIADYLLKYNYQEFKLKELIKIQWKKLTPKCWIFDFENHNELTNYNLQVLCDEINLTNNMNVTPDVYYSTFITFN